MVLGEVITAKRRVADIDLYVRFQDKSKMKITVKGFRPYFYVPDPAGEHLSIFGDRVKKIVLDDPGKVPEMRKNYEKTFEADIPYTRRFFIDMGIHSGVDVPKKSVVHYTEVKPADFEADLRLGIIDIEVLSDSGVPRDYDRPIIAVTIYDSYEDTYWTGVVWDKKGAVERGGWVLEFFASESDLLLAASERLARCWFDILTGWNVGFDVRYLRARADLLSIPLSFEGTQIVDMLEAYKKVFKRESYILKDVAVAEGILGEDEVMFAPEAIELYKKGDVMAMAEYNKKDVYIVKKIEDKHGLLLKFYWELKRAAGVVHLDDTFKNSVLIDTICLRIAKQEGVVLPTKPEAEYGKDSVKCKGAVVFKPPRGFVEGVAVCDMSRYYPSIIRSFNISPETKSDSGEIVVKTPRGVIRYKKHPKGLLPKVCEKLLAEREKLEKMLEKLTPGTPEYEAVKRKRDVVKYLVNAVYGVTAYEGFRLYDVDIADTITALAREGIVVASKIAEKLGYKTIYGDTDSIFIQVPLEKAPRVVKIINAVLRKYMIDKYGLDDIQIKLKFEKHLRRVFFVGVKKRYAAWVTFEDGKECDYVLIKGFEAVRTDTPPFIKKVQKELIEMAVRGASREEVLKYLRKKVSDFKRARLSEIAIPRGISKPLNEYAGTKPPHVRGAILANLYLGCNFAADSRVKMLWVKHVDGLPKTSVICFDDESRLRGRRVVVDWTKMLDFFRSKVEYILKLYNISWSEVVCARKSLSMFF